ncbi:MAG: hypothetical protein JJE42_12790 [Burkholderiales bacterium]|nr:hypothetical protein [Burkholderiales bacterium]
MKILVRFNGKEVLMRASTARALVRRGQATLVERAKPVEVERVVKPVADSDELKGQAKLAWLRENIRAHGGEPSGTTMASLESQLRILKSMVD